MRREISRSQNPLFLMALETSWAGDRWKAPVVGVIDEIGQAQVAALIEKGMRLLGSVYPRERMERQARLVEMSKGSFDALDETFYALIDSECGGFTSAANRYSANSAS